MQHANQQRTSATNVTYYSLMPQTFMGRVLMFLLATVVILLAVVFSVVFLAVGAVLLIVAIARGMWIAKKMSDNDSAGFIDGEYTVRSGPRSRQLSQRDHEDTAP